MRWVFEKGRAESDVVKEGGETSGGDAAAFGGAKAS